MHSSPNYCFSTSHEKRCGLEGRRISQVLFLLTLTSLNRACRNLVPAFPQRSPPWLLTKAACGDLRSAPDCRTRRASFILSYSYASPCGPALLLTQDPKRTFSFMRPVKIVASTLLGERRTRHTIMQERSRQPTVSDCFVRGRIAGN